MRLGILAPDGDPFISIVRARHSHTRRGPDVKAKFSRSGYRPRQVGFTHYGVVSSPYRLASGHGAETLPGAPAQS